MCTKAEVRSSAAEREVVCRVAGDVEAVRIGILGGVAVAGRVPDDHLVACGDPRACDLGVDQGGAPEVPDRRSEAHDLLGRGAVERRIRLQQRELVRVLGEREHAERDRHARRLVPGHDDQRERVVEVARAHRAAIDLGVHEQRHHVVLGLRTTSGVVAPADLAELQRRRAAEGHEAVLLGVGVGELVVEPVGGLAADEHHVAELHEPVEVLLRQAHQVAEHPDRDRRREALDDVELAIGDGGLDERADQAVQPLLVAQHRARREVLREQPAVLRVPGRIELHEVAPLVELLDRVVDDARRPPHLARERAVVLQHREDVVVARDVPEARPVGLLVPVDGSLALEALEDVPGRALAEEIVVEQVEGLTGECHCHLRSRR